MIRKEEENILSSLHNNKKRMKIVRVMLNTPLMTLMVLIMSLWLIIFTVLTWSVYSVKLLVKVVSCFGFWMRKIFRPTLDDSCL